MYLLLLSHTFNLNIYYILGEIAMAYGKQEKPKLFTDEQMRQFVTDGYVAFIPDVPHDVHKTVMEKLQYMVDKEFNYGNNVLPRVPEMDRILNSPEVRGALISVLGPGYIEHPHRFCHYTGPGVDQKFALQYHQDGYTPLGRPRQHYPRFARIMYYPQNTPVEIGPTYAIPGTQYHKELMDEDRHNGLPLTGKAGMVSITHFDVGHAAGFNKINKPRHMIKFVYTRAEEPNEPSWNCRDQVWKNPEKWESPHNLNLVWSHIWDWLCGKQNLYESFSILKSDSKNRSLYSNDLGTRISAMHSIAASGDIKAIPALIERLNVDPQWDRLMSIYTLGALGHQAVAPLVSVIKDSVLGKDDPITKIWKEGSFSMNDAAHALAAIGAASLDSLIELLNHPNEWVKVNAAYALGEMDSTAAKAVPALTHCLDDPSHCVVRTATDALSTIQHHSETFIPSLERLLKERRIEWQNIVARNWSPNDEVRVNATMLFTRLGKKASSSERLLLDKLADPNGHVSAFALEALRRIGTPLAMEGVMQYLMSRRWDESLTKERTF